MTNDKNDMTKLERCGLNLTKFNDNLVVSVLNIHAST